MTKEVISLPPDTPLSVLFEALLGIGNRRAMDAMLEERHAIAKRYQTVYSVVLADVDHFKAYNDRYGHTEADGVLRQIAQAMEGALRAADRLYRYGGEEFVAVLPETGAPGALRAAERLRQAVEGMGIAHQGSAGGTVTVSCGVSTAEPDVDLPDAPLHIITRAYRALYAAKHSGRNRVRTAD